MKDKGKGIGCSFFVLVLVMVAVLGVIVGALFVLVLPRDALNGSLMQIYGRCAVLLLWLFLCYFLQAILHEAGHLVFGLMTGYRFRSFRIGGIMWISRGGKIHLSRYRLAGTGGQCLMNPPEPVNGEFPVMLYDLGGVILNTLSGIILLVAGLCAGGMARAFMLVAAFDGLAIALMNGLPLRSAGITDGAYALALKGNPAARRAFWLQLKQGELTNEGVRLENMPAEWFVMPGDDALDNVLIAELAANCTNYLIACNRREEAAQAIDHLLSVKSALPPVLRCMLVCQRAVCGVLTGEPKEAVIAMLDNPFQSQMMRTMRSQLIVLCASYARALLTGDAENVRKLEARAQELAPSYPYPSEIDVLNETMAGLRENCAERARKEAAKEAEKPEATEAPEEAEKPEEAEDR